MGQTDRDNGGPAWGKPDRDNVKEGPKLLSKAWFQLSADMSCVCLPCTRASRAHPEESDVPALLRLSNCRRYEPRRGIREAVTLPQRPHCRAGCPRHPPSPHCPVPDARLLIQVDKDQMSARAITADWGGSAPTLARLQEAWRPAHGQAGVSGGSLAAAIQAAGEAAPGAQLNPVIALSRAARHGLDTRLERLVETAAERILKPQGAGITARWTCATSAPCSPSRPGRC